jgi:DNA replication protein DnaC
LTISTQPSARLSWAIVRLSHDPARNTSNYSTIASDELLGDLGGSLADRTTLKRIRYFTSFDLLIIDGFGFDRIERQETPQALSLLFKVIDRRNSHHSTALITNIDFEAWNEYLGDAPMVMALLDRLVDRAILMKFVDAKSYRAHRAQRTASGKTSNTVTSAKTSKAK